MLSMVSWLGFLPRAALPGRASLARRPPEKRLRGAEPGRSLRDTLRTAMTTAKLRCCAAAFFRFAQASSVAVRRTAFFRRRLEVGKCVCVGLG